MKTDRAVSELLDAGEYTVSCVRAPGGYAGCADLTVSVRPRRGPCRRR